MILAIVCAVPSTSMADVPAPTTALKSRADEGTPPVTAQVMSLARSGAPVGAPFSPPFDDDVVLRLSVPAGATLGQLCPKNSAWTRDSSKNNSDFTVFGDVRGVKGNIGVLPFSPRGNGSPAQVAAARSIDVPLLHGRKGDLRRGAALFSDNFGSIEQGPLDVELNVHIDCMISHMNIKFKIDMSKAQIVELDKLVRLENDAANDTDPQLSHMDPPAKVDRAISGQVVHIIENAEKSEPSPKRPVKLVIVDSDWRVRTSITGAPISRSISAQFAYKNADVPAGRVGLFYVDVIQNRVGAGWSALRLENFSDKGSRTIPEANLPK